ncbi:DUF3987 domain-containing protein [Megalodesulfovibrio gigas]|uniref:DUF3987 domain-containing protein n=1 Tax=Megalodesulfovibrio gigas (strain ATCC 19364 / DSM 1382 / NCIMB 9332 / VKM B-1759) TaxID=1121448 RepID=T2G982_MEGG1|nr:DUF3987 domain-containing protein [Megalodesulfovibrio gigas]AGW13140.1 hypothetical protein DGI_1287 [Megalodesulfovibrio gigas DSM 1382 = ATCC 19364]
MTAIPLQDAREKYLERRRVGEELVDRPQQEDDAALAPSCLPAPPPLPVHVFPESIQHMLQTAAEAFNVPLEAPACCLLALTGACIGRTRGLQIKPGWTEHPNLYVALVARSGMGKSPCAKAFFAPLWEAEKACTQQWKEANAQWEADVAAWEAQKRSKHPSTSPRPEPPPRQQLITDDATVESLTDIFADNPRGLLWYRDELAGLILDLDKYSSGPQGSTKTRLMTAYDSGPWKVSRVNKARTGFIPAACLSLFGTIQPAVLADIFTGKDAASGLLARVSFIRAPRDKPPLWTETAFNGPARATLVQLVTGLLRLDFHEDNPLHLTLEPDAKQLFIAWHDELAREQWLGDGEDQDSLLSKLRGQCLRLALQLHCLEDVLAGRDCIGSICAATMAGAIALANWLRGHQEQCWTLLGQAGRVQDPPPLHRRVALAVLGLEGDVQGGRLPTAAIHAWVNDGLDARCQVDSRAVGKACSKIGLRSSRKMHGGGWHIDAQALTRCRAIAGIAPTYPAGQPMT